MHTGPLEWQVPTCLAPRTTGTMHSGSVACVLSSMRMERNCILASLGSPAPTQVQQMTSAFWGRHGHQGTDTVYLTMPVGLGRDLECPALHPLSKGTCVGTPVCTLPARVCAARPQASFLCTVPQQLDKPLLLPPKHQHHRLRRAPGFKVVQPSGHSPQLYVCQQSPGQCRAGRTPRLRLPFWKPGLPELGG